MESLTNLLVDTIVKYCQHNGIEYDTEKASEYLAKTVKQKFPLIMEKIREEAKQADIFNQIDSGKLSPMVREVGQVTLRHEILLYAQEIVEHSKISD
jgi:membrane-bound lytic murein transglycosylase MltF